jgi:hypothetical protein
MSSQVTLSDGTVLSEQLTQPRSEKWKLKKAKEDKRARRIKD